LPRTPTITRTLGTHPSSSSPKFRFPETRPTNSPTQSDPKPLEGYQLQTISGHQGQTNASTNQGYAEINKASLYIIPSHREGNNDLLRNNCQRTFPRISNNSMETCQPSLSRHERYQGPALLCCPLLQKQQSCPHNRSQPQKHELQSLPPNNSPYLDTNWPMFSVHQRWTKFIAHGVPTNANMEGIRQDIESQYSNLKLAQTPRWLAPPEKRYNKETAVVVLAFVGSLNTKIMGTSKLRIVNTDCKISPYYPYNEATQCIDCQLYGHPTALCQTQHVQSVQSNILKNERDVEACIIIPIMFIHKRKRRLYT
jgi:hypothetical protein